MVATHSSRTRAQPRQPAILGVTTARAGASRAKLPRRLLAWYDSHRRDLPWRKTSHTADPYRVWLAETMLQQTRVATIAPRYEAFLSRFPTLTALAAAPVEEVLAAWAGLGYYARARKLHECACLLAEQHGGRFPRQATSLRALPGIGPYTAAAVAAIAFEQAECVVDGNVLRVMARLHCVETPLPQARSILESHAAALTPRARPGDYAQALMDLGATVCKPRKPNCPACPWRTACQAHARGVASDLPRRAPKPQRPLRHGAIFWLRRADGAVLMRRRPAKGLLGGMMEFPGSDWRPDKPREEAMWLAEAPCFGSPLAWERLDGLVSHGFTHFRLELVVYAARLPRRKRPPAGMRWVPWEALDAEALPSLMRKVARRAAREARGK